MKFKVGDKVRVKRSTDDKHRGKVGFVVATWPPGGDFQVEVRFNGERYCYAENEVERP